MELLRGRAGSLETGSEMELAGGSVGQGEEGEATGCPQSRPVSCVPGGDSWAWASLRMDPEVADSGASLPTCSPWLSSTSFLKGRPGGASW